MGGPAYTRLDVDERRRRLLALGRRALHETRLRRAVDGEDRARGRDLEGAALPLLPVQGGVLPRHPGGEGGRARRAHRSRTRSCRRSSSSRARWTPTCGWVDENASSFDKMIRSSGVPEVRALLDRVRGETAARIVDGLRGDKPASPLLRTAVRGWLGFMDGACLDWIEHRDLDRETLHGLLLGTLLGADPRRRRGRALRRADVLRGRRRRPAPRPGRSAGGEPFGPYARSDGITSTRRPPTFMPSKPWSQPGITCPAPSGNEIGSPRSHELSNTVPSLYSAPT